VFDPPEADLDDQPEVQIAALKQQVDDLREEVAGARSDERRKVTDHFVNMMKAVKSELTKKSQQCVELRNARKLDKETAERLKREVAGLHEKMKFYKNKEDTMKAFKDVTAGKSTKWEHLDKPALKDCLQMLQGELNRKMARSRDHDVLVSNYKEQLAKAEQKHHVDKRKLRELNAELDRRNEVDNQNYQLNDENRLLKKKLSSDVVGARPSSSISHPRRKRIRTVIESDDDASGSSLPAVRNTDTKGPLIEESEPEASADEDDHQMVRQLFDSPTGNMPSPTKNRSRNASPKKTLHSIGALSSSTRPLTSIEEPSNFMKNFGSSLTSKPIAKPTAGKGFMGLGKPKKTKSFLNDRSKQIERENRFERNKRKELEDGADGLKRVQALTSQLKSNARLPRSSPKKSLGRSLSGNKPIMQPKRNLFSTVRDARGSSAISNRPKVSATKSSRDSDTITINLDSD